MEDEKRSKKPVVLMIVGLVLFIILLLGASFSYYLVTGLNTTTTTAGRVTMEKAGTVALTQGVSNIYLDVTAAQMSQTNQGTDYYGMSTETTAATTAQNHVLATIQATGGEDDTVYECSMGYSISVSQISGSSNSAYAALESEDADLTIDVVPSTNSGNAASNIVGTNYLKDANYLNTTGISAIIIHGNTSLQIVGDLILHNLNKSQNDLAELGANVSFQVTSFNCNPIETETFALTLDNGISGIDVGDEVVFGNEHFYVINTNATETTLLAKQNLLVGYNIAYSYTNNYDNYTLLKTYDNNDNGYGLQNSEAVGFSNNGSICKAVVPFSGTNYWDNGSLIAQYNSNGGSYNGNPYPFVYNKNLSNITSSVSQEVYEWGNNQEYVRVNNNGYTISYYVEQYVNKLIFEKGAPITITGRLLSYEEIKSIVNLITFNVNESQCNIGGKQLAMEAYNMDESSAEYMAAALCAGEEIDGTSLKSMIAIGSITSEYYSLLGLSNVKNDIKLTNASYWLGSACDSDRISAVFNGFDCYYYFAGPGAGICNGVRPVIVVPTSSIQTS